MTHTSSQFLGKKRGVPQARRKNWKNLLAQERDKRAVGSSRECRLKAGSSKPTFPDHLREPSNDVFAVVEDQQKPSWPEVRGHHIERRPASWKQHLGNARPQSPRAWAREGGGSDQPHTVGKTVL